MTTAIERSLYATGYIAPGISDAARPAAGNGGFKRSVACYVTAGTMSLLTLQAIENQSLTSVAPVRFEITGARSGAAQPVELERSVTQDLMRIREVLKPTVLELANLFGVSRQAVYNWQAGAQPDPRTAQQLAQLARVADIFAGAGLSVDARSLRRKVAGGGTLLNALASGHDAESVARGLLPTLKREAAQRERLQAQLAGRERASVKLNDYGAPHLTEGA